ncbi:MAG: hypothetical protein AUI11_07810 [Acidobacteria bacterium 13_2_20CM_2_66_4]|nr:MAG: hypothetical protein AUI11_07810 [Acidobacteria bacterium 13_2_20CM_2_66_4]
MSEPRISAFARLANGNADPTRVISGQQSRLSRTMHGIFYDDVHDEIVVPVALGGAVLTLPGDAAGDAPPKRVLQGPKTGIVQPDTIYVDLKHDELIVESGDDAVLVFPRTAQGDVAPSRRIGGPNSGVSNIYGLAAGRDCLVVANRVDTGGRASDDAILVFNRTDNGDSSPCGASTTTATCRRAASSGDRPPDWSGRPASRSIRRTTRSTQSTA